MGKQDGSTGKCHRSEKLQHPNRKWLLGSRALNCNQTLFDIIEVKREVKESFWKIWIFVERLEILGRRGWLGFWGQNIAVGQHSMEQIHHTGNLDISIASKEKSTLPALAKEDAIIWSFCQKRGCWLRYMIISQIITPSQMAVALMGVGWMGWISPGEPGELKSTFLCE